MTTPPMRAPSPQPGSPDWRNINPPGVPPMRDPWRPPGRPVEADPNKPYNPPAPPPMSEPDRMKSQLDDFDRQITGYKGQVEELRKKAAGLKGTPLEWMIPQVEAELTRTQELLGKVQEARSTVQNKYWETTGQFDKLLAGTERDAFMAVNALFKNFGLESLAGKIFEYVKNGYSADTISILLQDTAEYKQRFVGNEARKKAGLPVLSPAEYLATESAYRQVMESAGLPKGFYDTYSDFADFMGKNVSPSEVKERVDMAVRATTLADENVKQALKQMGLSEGEMVAYWLDKEKSLPFLKKAEMTAQIGAQALSQRLTFDQQYAASLASRGITGEQAAQGYSAIAAELENLSTLGSVYGERWNQRTSEEAMFEGSGTALAQKRRLASQERGAFGGAAGGARGGLAQRGGQR